MGFGATHGASEVDGSGRADLLRRVTPEDLVEFGLLPEFVGRIGQIVEDAVRSGPGARALYTAVNRVTRRAFFELPAGLGEGKRSVEPIVLLDARSWEDGRYGLEWPGARRRQGRADVAAT